MIKVVNRSILSQNHSGQTFNIMRPFPLGNPYRITPDQPRNIVIGLYRRWLWAKIKSKDPRVCNALSDIKTTVLTGTTVYLVCCCKPASCHGDVIKSAVEWCISKTK